MGPGLEPMCVGPVLVPGGTLSMSLQNKQVESNLRFSLECSEAPEEPRPLCFQGQR